VWRPLRLEALEGRWVPTTLTPTTFLDGNVGSGSLRDAVLQFNADTGTDDDIIQLEAGTYALTIQNVSGRHETAGLTGDLNLTQTSHRWIIQGAGSSGDNVTIIDANQLQDRVFQIVNPGTQVIFQDLVLRGGLAQDNGADGAFEGTTDALGGGIFNNGGNVTLDNVVVQNNVARGAAAFPAEPGYDASGGGIYSTGGALTTDGVTLANNEVIGGRGGNARFMFEHGGDGGWGIGGGLYATGGSLDIAHSTIASNLATGGRGGDGIPLSSTPGGTGGPGLGGGLYVSGSALTIATSTISSNNATGGDAGVLGGGGPADGGGISNGGALTVSNSILSGNSAGYGGGISNGGALTVSNSTLSGNSADQGGGISNGGALTVSNSTLSGNSAYLYGGGIYNRGTLTVSNSTLSGNSATDIYYGSGGGIYAYLGHSNLTNVTLSANRSTFFGGGLYVYFDLPVLHNTLIAGNFRGATGTTRDDVYGGLDPGGDYNLIGDGTGMGGLNNGVNGNQVGSASAPIDPLLGPLQDNGGPTLTHALLRGSPAIDAGSNAYATDWDQRGPGYPRIVNGVIDIGAFEVQAHAHGRPTGQRLPDPLPVSGLPLPTGSPGFMASPAVLGPATVPSVPLRIAPNQEVPVGPQAGPMDQGLASLHKEASGPPVARWPAQEPIQAVWLNLDLSPEAVGLVR
jgi:hypothetical protein